MYANEAFSIIQWAGIEDIRKYPTPSNTIWRFYQKRATPVKKQIMELSTQHKNPPTAWSLLDINYFAQGGDNLGFAVVRPPVGVALVVSLIPFQVGFGKFSVFLSTAD